uniref:Uncharacterized protein n=1 Tax=Panagrolaimus superbus TaxID=310955 RepID=A0A914YN38_9BILA
MSGFPIGFLRNGNHQLTASMLGFFFGVKVKQSLIISSLAQLALSVIFIIIPISTFFGIICFQITNTANLTCILFCFFVSYAIIESIATLYFVRPYRKAMQQIVYRNFLKKKNKAVSILVVSQVAAISINK